MSAVTEQTLTEAGAASRARTVDMERLRDAVGFTTTFRAWGNKRKADLSKVQTEADKSQLGLSKRLVDCEEYEAIKTKFGELRGWIYGHTVPSFFKKSFQLASREAVPVIEARMQQAQLEIAALVNTFAGVFAGKIEEARAKLADQFNPLDYPDTESLRQSFGVSWNWIAFTVPEGLPPELRQQETEKLQQQFAEAGEEIKTALRESFAELIQHATDKLTVAPGEKPKVFRDSLIGNIQEFIDTFSSRNLLNDSELAALVVRAKEVLTGLQPDRLRKFASVREQTRSKFEEIKTALDGMVTTRAVRKLDLSEEE